jgi:hypothetical protein
MRVTETLESEIIDKGEFFNSVCSFVYYGTGDQTKGLKHAKYLSTTELHPSPSLFLHSWDHLFSGGDTETVIIVPPLMSYVLSLLGR